MEQWNPIVPTGWESYNWTAAMKQKINGDYLAIVDPRITTGEKTHFVASLYTIYEEAVNWMGGWPAEWDYPIEQFCREFYGDEAWQQILIGDTENTHYRYDMLVQLRDAVQRWGKYTQEYYAFTVPNLHW
ncbi:hypothetical protein ACTVZO_18215 [Streptomyces sp. IBSNAI002]|uniref:hypothetical protein n=1 Tax=Streptomyces sp. IBSNAI002 TaxID=3457500 RepID=UPI003FD55ED4